MQKPQKIVIAGCGAAGVEAVRKLKNKFDLAVISPDCKLVCQALLPMFVSGSIDKNSLFVDLKYYFRNNDVRYIKRFASFIKQECKMLFTSRTPKSKIIRGVGYDHLIVAIGSIPCFYNIKGAENALLINTLESAEKTKKRLEKAEKVAIVGSGMSGVEVAYELAIKGYSVTVFEIANKILPGMNDKASFIAEKELKKVGIAIQKSCAVKEIQDGNILYTKLNGSNYSKNYEIQYDEVIWCAGVKGAYLPGLSYAEYGIFVNDKLEAGENISAIGDCAQVGKGSNMATKTVLEAKRQARFVVKNIVRSDNPYKPLSTISKPFAIVTLGKTGFIVYGNKTVFKPFSNLIYKLKMNIANKFLNTFRC